MPFQAVCQLPRIREAIDIYGEVVKCNLRDVIGWQLDDTLDINGWDLQKALRLLHSSNPTLFEWPDICGLKIAINK